MLKRSFINDPSLVLYLPLYELDGNSFMSKDAYGFLFTVTGATWGMQGRTFDGNDDKISTPDTSAFAVTRWTIGVWINLASGITINSAVFSNHKTAIPRSGIVLGVDTAYNPYFYWWDTTNNQRGLTTTTVLPSNSFTHLACSYDGVASRIFINGREDSSAAVVATMADPVADLTIGMSAIVAENYDFRGIIGEVRLYNRALTPTELQNLYLATKGRYQ